MLVSHWDASCSTSARGGCAVTFITASANSHKPSEKKHQTFLPFSAAAWNIYAAPWGQ